MKACNTRNFEEHRYDVVLGMWPAIKIVLGWSTV